MDGVHIRVLGGFECLNGDAGVTLPLGAQRLLALLALHDGGLHRAAAGRRLWPNSPEGRAAANLRSALWRAKQIGNVAVIDRLGPRLRLTTAVTVDIHEFTVHAEGVADPAGRLSTLDGWEAAVGALRRELLPDWPDDWLVLERERWDLARLHTLEGLAQQLCAGQRYPAALQTALAAITIDPTRETAHRLVIEIHITEGNAASALQHYQRYRRLLQRELGLAPSQRLEQLVRGLLTP